MENLETQTPSSRTSKKSTLSQAGGDLPDLQADCLKEPFIGVKEKTPKNLKNNLEIQEKEAPVAVKEPASYSKIGQRVLAIKKAESLQTVEIAPSDFNTLEYEIMSAFEIIDMDD
jgi:hypothetical protein